MKVSLVTEAATGGVLQVSRSPATLLTLLTDCFPSYEVLSIVIHEFCPGDEISISNGGSKILVLQINIIRGR